ncbi:MAG: Xaa-Pro peptidase family protein [Actinomycetota bacterium]
MNAVTRHGPITTPPDEAEIGRRLDRVRASMQAEGIDLMVVHDPDNVFYLTNFANYIHERPFVLVVAIDGPLRFVVPELERRHVEVRSVGALELIAYVEFPAPVGDTWADRLQDALIAGSPSGDRIIGVEPNCPLFVVDSLPAEPRRSDLLADARMVKTDYEIGRITYSSEVLSEAHNGLMDVVKPGDMAAILSSQTTQGILLRLLGDIPEANMLATSVGAVVQPPSVSDDPHNFTNVLMTMEEGGPHVSVLNAVLNGYGAEIERTFFLNRVPEGARAPFEAMMEARRTAFELTVPGNHMSDVDKAVRQVFERRGYGDHLLHRTGHSFGVTGHEGPFLAVADDRVIEPGMLFSIEPGIYLRGVGGFRHSDTVLTTTDGNVSLTTAPDSLDELTFHR